MSRKSKWPSEEAHNSPKSLHGYWTPTIRSLQLVLHQEYRKIRCRGPFRHSWTGCEAKSTRPSLGKPSQITTTMNQNSQPISNWIKQKEPKSSHKWAPTRWNKTIRKNNQLFWHPSVVATVLHRITQIDLREKYICSEMPKQLWRQFWTIFNVRRKESGQRKQPENTYSILLIFYWKNSVLLLQNWQTSLNECYLFVLWALRWSSNC